MIPRLKQVGKYLIWAVALILLGVLFVLWALARRSTKSAATDRTGEQLVAAIAKASTEIATANAQAAIEVTAARTKDAQVKAELREVVAIKDGKERRQKLADLGARVGL